MNQVLVRDASLARARPIAAVRGSRLRPVPAGPVSDCPASEAFDAMRLGRSHDRGQMPMGICGAFVTDILKPYRDNARYLKSANIISWRKARAAHEPRCSGPLVVGSGRFAIGDSCYIDDTGHFNAVEFNICYNQLAYVVFAKCIEAGTVPELGFLSFADFKRGQLPSWLIASIEGVRFSRQMCRGNFVGELTVEAVSSVRGTRFFFTTVAFSDSEGVKSSGRVVLAYSPGES